jgi:transcriptional regulator with XRE-family HTH domain
MTVIDEWTGRHAHALRTALRLTNEAFAEHLGISPRTLTKWRERPEVVPSPFLQEALDTFLKQAPPDAHLRFAANLGLDQRRMPIDDNVLTQLNTALGDLARALARLQAEDPERSRTA